MRTEGSKLGTAVLLEERPPNGAGAVWRLYKLDPPLDGHDRVVVSAVPRAFDTGIPETYIFPAYSDEFNVASWGELEGSFRGEMNHNKALRNAGYEVVTNG